jgi:hypothetical protein
MRFGFQRSCVVFFAALIWIGPQPTSIEAQQPAPLPNNWQSLGTHDCRHSPNDYALAG